MRSGRLTIERDEWGVPHITADNEAAAFFGVGYAQAQDHLPVIAATYGLLSGRPVLTGENPAAPVVNVALMFQRWRHLEESRAALPRLGPDVVRNVSAFVDGIQRFVDLHPTAVGATGFIAEPAMAIGVYRALLWAYATMDGLKVVLAAGVDVESDVSELTEVMRSRRAGAGMSNEWLVLPSRTAFGGTALLSDPHGSLDGLPMSEVHVRTPSLHYVGFHALGAALPMLGHTDDVAWGWTTGSPVVSDCYAVAMSGPSTYEVDGEQRSLVSHDAVVRHPTSGEEVRRTYTYTEHNDVLCPVVGTRQDLRYVLATPYMHVAHLFEQQLYDQLKARTVGDFRAAMAGVGQPLQNIMAADRHGDAFYVRAGRVPIRPTGIDLSSPLDGNTAATAWQGIHPLDDLVQTSTPTCGYLQNNNIAPDRMMADTTGTTLAASRYPAYIFGDTPGRINHRGRRALELLSEARDLTVQDLLAMATDDTWIDVDRWQQALKRALDVPADHGPASDRVRTELLAFDARAKPDSVAALHYWAWRSALVADPEFSDEMAQAVDDGHLLDSSGSASLVRALEGAAKLLEPMPDGLDTQLGAVFRIGRGGSSTPGRSVGIQTRKRPDAENPYSSIVMPLQVMLYGEPDADGRRWAILGSHTCRLTVFGERTRSYSLLLYGQSSDPASPHFVDQVELFSRGELKPTYFADGDLDGHVVSAETLEA